MFRDNLKGQIEYKGYIIKELAAKAGISKKTLDSYVGVQACMPAADVAVRLAKALDTSVEFLVTGTQPELSLPDAAQKSDFELYLKYRKIIQKLDSLSARDQKLVTAMLENMSIL